MNAIKDIYHYGKNGLIEKTGTQETSEVLLIFPRKKERNQKIG